MTEEEYAQTQRTIVLLVGIVYQMPLDEFIATISRSEAIAPILDPTLWMRGNQKLDEIKALAVGLRKFQRAIEEVAKGETQ